MRVGVRFLGIAVTAALLSACATDPSRISGMADVPEAQTDHYIAHKDGPFTVPAVPLDKVPAQFHRQTVAFPTDEVPGTIIIDPTARFLHLVTGKNTAIRYGISVGRAGFEWSGVAIVAQRRPWPRWTPPPEMIERQPELAKWENGQPGGPTNPLGARALYLTSNGIDHGYRIHGTPDWRSIGRNASSGCIRMINHDVIDLYTRVPDGAKVIVLKRDGGMPARLTLPPPQKKPPVVAAEPVAPPVVQTGKPS